MKFKPNANNLGKFFLSSKDNVNKLSLPGFATGLLRSRAITRQLTSQTHV